MEQAGEGDEPVLPAPAARPGRSSYALVAVLSVLLVAWSSPSLTGAHAMHALHLQTPY